MQNIPTMEDGVTSLLAEFFNQIPNEMENVITSSGQTLNPGVGPVTLQFAKALSNYIANADYYTDSGTANNYVLSITSGRNPVTGYFDGMRVRFFAANANTSATVTINVAGLGVKNVKQVDGTDLVPGQILNSIHLVYNSAAGTFRLDSSSAEFLEIGRSVSTYNLSLSEDPKWLAENGQEVSRVTYAALFSVIGTLYGNGDGSTTFNLPSTYSSGPGSFWSSDGVGSGIPASSNINSMTSTPNGDIYALRTNDDKVYVSIDDGVNWTLPANANLGSFSGGHIFGLANGSLILLPDSSANYFTSTDGAATWTVRNASASGLTLILNSPCVAQLANGELHLWDRVEHMYKSLDNGVTWASTGTAGLPAGTTAPGTMIGTANGNMYLAIADDKLYKSINGAISWTDASNGLDTFTTQSAVIAKDSNDLLYFIDSGIDLLYRSTNEAGEWSRFGMGLPSSIGQVAMTGNSNGYLFLHDITNKELFRSGGPDGSQGVLANYMKALP